MLPSRVNHGRDNDADNDGTPPTEAPTHTAESAFIDAILSGPGSLTVRDVLTLEPQVLLVYTPLLMAKIGQLASLPDRIPEYKGLLRALMIRKKSSRPIKLRMSLLMNLGDSWTAGGRWSPIIAHDPHCYDRATEQFDKALRASFGAGEPSSSIPTVRVPSSGPIDTTALLNSDSLLIEYATHRFFHPTRGIPLSTNRVGLRQVRHSFRQEMALLFLMSDLEISDVKVAFAIGRKMFRLGLARRAGTAPERVFGGDDVYVVSGRVEADPEDLSFGILGSGEGDGNDASTNGAENSEEISSESVGPAICVKNGFDLIDLQSYHFFWNRLWEAPDGLIEGLNFGVSAVVHPMAVGPAPFLEPDATNHLTGEEDRTATGGAQRRSESFESAFPSFDHGGSIIHQIEVTKVFSSLARPAVIRPTIFPHCETVYPRSLANPQPLLPEMIAKKGDNLVNDMSVTILLRIFNRVWAADEQRFGGADVSPFAFPYDVIPTGQKTGLLEVVSGMEPLNKYDWASWSEKYAHNTEVLECMVRSAAGSSIASYVLGFGDRHFDNIQIKDSKILVHIDFGFILGDQPPLETPKFSISRAMERAFRDVGIWHSFVTMCCNAFLSLRERSAELSSVVSLLLQKAGRTKDEIFRFLASKDSLNITETDPEVATAHVRKQVEQSASSWETLFRAFAHDNVDPMFYRMLEMRFPPALIAVYLMEAGKAEAEEEGEDASTRSPSSRLLLKPSLSAPIHPIQRRLGKSLVGKEKNLANPCPTTLLMGSECKKQVKK